ncbi:MAG: threonine synthase [Clostridia bacterium]|nr:threonine synthase [Clostridia bacterium]
MRYISTRGQAPAVDATEAIIKGLAQDGGLYVPEELPAFFPDNLAKLDYAAVAKKIFALYLSSFSGREISNLVKAAYNSNNFPAGEVGMVSLGDSEVLELWHGPTAAFKDMALQALPHLLLRSLAKSGGEKEIVILVATSGDTGKAALEGFRDVPHTKIIVFYPEDGVSQIQELQMNTTGGENTRVIGVLGNFDDCQNGVKQIFADQELKRQMAEQGYYFSSANSINWGRLLPQIVYYYYGYGRMVAKKRIAMGEPIEIAVPTGNFGNILAAWYARRMGLPVSRFYCASNCNNVLTEVINEGTYNRLRPFHKTISPSMDILISSNFERFIFDISGNDSFYTGRAFELLQAEGKFYIEAGLRAKYAELMVGGYAEEDECRAAIRDAFEQYHYLLDPHTAVGYAVANKLRAASPGGDKLLLVSTASPYKFPAAVLEALGKLPEGREELALPAVLAKLSGTPVPKNLAALAALPIRHQQVCATAEMTEMIRNELGL